MMTTAKLSPTEMIAREIERFLQSKEPEVICIRGRWGVGKTYAWNEALKAVIAKKKLGLRIYSPVSLFGLTNLSELKYSIFLNRQEGASIADTSAFGSLAANWGETLDKGLRAVLDTLTGKGASEMIQAAAFASIKEQIVCIDDIERKGKDLRTMDVLGLVSLLREHRRCKVALILNDERLEEEKAELAKYQEKVIDTSFLYAPTPEECANIALKDNKDFGPQLTERCVRLQISNIRVIKKIERAIRKVQPALKPFDPKIFQSAISSITLFGWAQYSEHEAGPTEQENAPRNLNQEIIEYITTKHGKALYEVTEDLSPKEQRWDAILRDYDFGEIDELDGDLCEGILNGYFDEHKIEASAAILQARLTHADASQAWSAAWDKFHGSFANDEEGVVGTFQQAFKEWCKYCGANDLYGLMRILKQLGRDAQAQEALEMFMSARNEEDVSFFDLEGHIFNREINDVDLRKAFSDRAASLRKTPEPRDILLRIYQNASWHSSELEILAKLSDDEFYEMFKTSSVEDHRRIIAAALDFRKFANPNPTYTGIANKAENALKRIGAESKLNRARVRAYGINMPEEARSREEPVSQGPANEAMD